MTGRRESIAAGAAALFTGVSAQEEAWDVIVIGSGAAGLSAALEARKAGASVLVLEKMDSIGGNSVISEGQVAVPGTPMQSDEGLADSPELFAQDMLTLGYINKPDHVRCVARAALETFFWTEQELGVAWYHDRVEYDIGHSVRRCALLRNHSGSGLVYPLLERVTALGAVIRLRRKVERLVRDPETGVVAGVTTSDGRFIAARRGVVLASGGFGADIPMRMMQNWRLSEHVGTTTQPGATSELLREAIRIGAWAIHMEYIHCIPDASPDEKGWGSAWRFSRYCAASQGVWVVQETGRRFVNETAPNDVRTNAVLDVVNDGCHCLAVADARAVRHPHSVIFGAEDVERLVARGLVRRYDALEELALDAAVPLAALRESVADYNRALAIGGPDAMGRFAVPEAEPMEEGPWYCSRVLAKVLLCGGGVATDLSARVLSVENDRPIPGLYAAGEVTGGLHGNSRLTSCGLLDAVIFGRIAGRAAAASKGA